MLAGCAALRLSAITAAAASACTQGWHTATMGALADRLQELHQVGDVVVEAEPAGAERHVAGIVPVGDVDVVVGEQRAHRAAQERAEMPDRGATTSTRAAR